MNIALHLKLAGILQLALALAHLGFARRFKWKQDLAQLTLLNRQIFYVHTFFICVVLLLFGGWSFVFPNELLSAGRLGTAVLGGVTLFWFARLLIQFFGYSPALWRGNSAHTVAHIVFSLLWCYFACVYANATLQTLRKSPVVVATSGTVVVGKE